MPIRNIHIELAYWADTEEDNRLVIDAAMLGVIDTRAVAQTVIMSGAKSRPPPTIKVTIEDADGLPREVIPEDWQAKRIAEAEESTDDL